MKNKVILILILISLVLIIPVNNVNALSDDFTSSDNWTLTEKFSINSGRLTWTDLGRVGNYYAIHNLSETISNEYNISFKFEITSSTLKASVFFEISPTINDVCSNTQISDSIMYSGGQSSYTPLIYLRNIENGRAERISSSHAILEDTVYDAYLKRFNDSGTWKIQAKVWSGATIAMFENMTLVKNPSEMNYFIIHNYDYDSADYKSTGYIDDYNDNLDAEAIGENITSIPSLTTFVGINYNYTVISENESVTWTLNTNATFLSLENNSIVGIADNIENKQFYVNISASNNKYQNYTLFSYIGTLEDLSPSYDSIGWSTHAQASAIHNDKIYITYSAFDGAENGKINIIMFDLVTGNWSQSYTVGDQITDLNHGHAGVIVDDLGYIHVFYGCHNSAMQYKKSSQPNDISSWVSQTSPANDATYPHVYKKTNGDIVLIWRHTITEFNKDWYYSTSTNNGVSWSSPNNFMNIDSNYIIYPGQFFAENKSGNLIININFQIYDHNVDEQRDLYYVKLNLTDGNLYTANNTNIGTSLSQNELDLIRIYDSGNNDICEGVVKVYLDNIYISFIEKINGIWYPSFISYTNNAWNNVENLNVSVEWGNNCISTLFVNEDGSIDYFFHHSYNTSKLGGNIERWFRDINGEWSSVGKVLDESQSTSINGQFAMPYTVQGSENLIYFCELSDIIVNNVLIKDYTTLGGVFLYHKTYGFILDGMPLVEEIINPEPEPEPEPEPSNPFDIGKMLVILACIFPFIGFILWAFGKE